MKHAILNIADTGALESTTIMLRAAGYYCSRPDHKLLAEIRRVSLTPVYSVDELVNAWGYDWPMLSDLAKPDEMLVCDLFVDVKGHVNYPALVQRWPRLENRILWCCLNGGDPLKRTDDLPWADPPCPILSNNQWYKDITRYHSTTETSEGRVHNYSIAPWNGRAYTCYPPYARVAQRSRTGSDGPPICLVHNVQNWGHGHVIPVFTRLGGVCYGGGEGNSRLLHHHDAMVQLRNALCMVHLKVGDTVGYATIEAMCSACPFVCSQFYINETRLHDLLEPGRTCLTFDPDNAESSLSEVLQALKDPAYNFSIGCAGQDRLFKLMWRKDVHLPSWLDFLDRNIKQ